ncbi:hypothetical protein Taro_004775 [Colocasia esculenta]|uniref:1-phosphatidylinositol-4-phosphate 5-kinase n=1 Tax=Colocasia esculenta TaxID=4460 RepID=A0A843TN05_COLES|nr:hypothetical protein [Colocasia esculenta]
MYRDQPCDKVGRAQRQQQSAAARWRGCGIFLPMSVVPAEDVDGSSTAATSSSASASAATEDEPEEVPACGSTYVGNGDDDGEVVYHAERLLSNGDFYAGTWAGHLPHGFGKYLWADGCMYEGEWFRGSATGRGRFLWPSGATYEGEFRSGFMDGVGTYTGSSGDTYHGLWSMNLKHGWGRKSYSNGDSYDGRWRRGVQDGHGRYVWSNGDEYDGSWKAGAVYGRGVFTSVNGNYYDGDWKDGVPCSKSRCRRVDGGGHNIGIWSKGASVKEGAKGPPPASAAGWKMASHGEEETVGRAGGSQLVNWVCSGAKKQGKAIERGHKNYELMLSLQQGIRYSVGRPGPDATLDLKASAFHPREKIWTRFPPEGTKHTPPHQSCEFKWKDYCPVVFRSLRKLFKVDAADYMVSICGSDALRELPSPGKSGSCFYLTHDDRYMIKTIRKSQVKVLLRMLSAYYNHVRAFESTLITKFFGLHCVKLTGPMQRKVHFIVMGNVFFSEYGVHRRFDLKGSSHGRMTENPEVEMAETTTLKDLDLNFIFWLPKSRFQEFQRQVDRDCEFLEQQRVMDYSLLLTGMRNAMLLATRHVEGCGLRREAIKLGVNMPARVQQTQCSDGDSQPTGEPTGKLHHAALFLGIIDTLQDYDMGKKLEHAYKSLQHDPTSISAVDPTHYSRRFRDFMLKVFREDKL